MRVDTGFFFVTFDIMFLGGKEAERGVLTDENIHLLPIDARKLTLCLGR